MKIWVYRQLCAKYGFIADISDMAKIPQHLFVKYPDGVCPPSGRFSTLFAHSFKEIDRMEPSDLEERLLQFSLEDTFGG